MIQWIPTESFDDEEFLRIVENYPKTDFEKALYSRLKKATFGQHDDAYGDMTRAELIDQIDELREELDDASREIEQLEELVEDLERELAL